MWSMMLAAFAGALPRRSARMGVAPTSAFRCGGFRGFAFYRLDKGSTLELLDALVPERSA
jgi:hypothetical protein